MVMIRVIETGLGDTSYCFPFLKKKSLNVDQVILLEIFRNQNHDRIPFFFFLKKKPPQKNKFFPHSIVESISILQSAHLVLVYRYNTIQNSQRRKKRKKSKISK